MKKNGINLAAVILAGGKGMRMDGNYKQFIKIGGKPVLFYSLREFINASCVEKIVIVVPHEKIDYAKNIVSLIDSPKNVAVIAGGPTRQSSVYNALKYLACCGCDISYVMFHDAARPLVTSMLVEQIYKQAKRYDGAILGSPSVDLCFHVENLFIQRSLPAGKTFLGQTPQCFRMKDILRAHMRHEKQNQNISVDNLDLLLKVFPMAKIKMVSSFLPNFKITYKHDIALLDASLKYRNAEKLNR